MSLDLFPTMLIHLRESHGVEDVTPSPGACEHKHAPTGRASARGLADPSRRARGTYGSDSDTGDLASL